MHVPSQLGSLPTNSCSRLCQPQLPSSLKWLPALLAKHHAGPSRTLVTVCSASSVASTEGSAFGEAGLPPVPIPHLRWGASAEQGPRESMEDVTQIVPNARCGFFFASKYAMLSHYLSFRGGLLVEILHACQGK